VCSPPSGLPPTIAVLTTREGLASNWVNALLEDRDGNIWVATNDGLSLLAPRLLEGVRVLDKLGRYCGSGRKRVGQDLC